MIIQIKRDVVVEATDRKNDELYNLPLKKWDRLQIEKINDYGRQSVDIITYDGNTWWDVPVDAYEIV